MRETEIFEVTVRELFDLTVEQRRLLGENEKRFAGLERALFWTRVLAFYLIFAVVALVVPS